MYYHYLSSFKYLRSYLKASSHLLAHLPSEDSNESTATERISSWLPHELVSKVQVFQHLYHLMVTSSSTKKAEETQTFIKQTNAYPLIYILICTMSHPTP
jgi:hypothetical protein